MTAMTLRKSMDDPGAQGTWSPVRTANTASPGVIRATVLPSACSGRIWPSRATPG
jgi:hypothetical protein